jgi:ATP-dependent Clp protease ATP-binding subunit ClpC
MSMKLQIPAYVEQWKEPDQASEFYRIRALFEDHASDTHNKLSRAMDDFVRGMHKLIRELNKQDRHDDLARLAFSPRLSDRVLKIVVEHMKRRIEVRQHVVWFRDGDRRIAMLPGCNNLWFAVERGQELEARATEVVNAYYRHHENRQAVRVEDIEAIALCGSAWLITVELDVWPRSLTPRPTAFLNDLDIFSLFSSPPDGARELNRVGRCLDWEIDTEAPGIIGREDKLAVLERAFESRDGRAILLVGPHLAGKTALVEEFVRRRNMKRRHEQYHQFNRLWRLSPQRLIAGMSLVGEWQQRFLAILKHAHWRRHILYFEDVLGILRAGRTSQSDFNVADLLKPALELGEVRLLGEATPAAYRLLREQDRAFADHFQVIHVQQTDARTTKRILLTIRRHLEAKTSCSMTPQSISLAQQLTGRYLPQQAFPGKAVSLLRSVVAHRGNRKALDDEDVLKEFARRTGLSSWLFDTKATFDREQIHERLAQHVVGQPEAVEAVAAVVNVARARLNDPDRPLAALLFIGPTGVGKTECAKALAGLLADREDRLQRFDMNEYGDSEAVTRLIGDFRNPVGLLTGAVSQNPFGVLLFDEIEKAHGDVHDLLLQVLGEGHLTDARGVTFSFAHTIVIMTSNLGAREAAAGMGFDTAAADTASTFRRAAERFFRPEFFNRIDRIVSFRRLDAATLARIAQLQIEQIRSRPGLVNRATVLRLHGGIMERLSAIGQDPSLGARAIKRTIETQVVAPLAARLAQTAPGLPAVIDLLPADDGFHARATPLAPAPPVYATRALQGAPTAPEQFLEAAQQVIDRSLARCDHLRPVGAFAPESLSPRQLAFFDIKDLAEALERRISGLQSLLQSPRGRLRLQNPQATRRTRKWKPQWTRNPPLRQEAKIKDILSALDLEHFVERPDDLPKTEWDTIRTELSCDLALLAASAEAVFDTTRPWRWLLFVQSLGMSGAPFAQLEDSQYLEPFFQGTLLNTYDDLLSKKLQLSTTRVTRSQLLGLEIQGGLASSLLASEQGVHLFRAASGTIVLVQVALQPLAETDDPDEVLMAIESDKERRLNDPSAAGLAPVVEYPDTGISNEPRIIRVYGQSGLLYFNHQIEQPGAPTRTVDLAAANLLSVVVGQLPPPPWPEALP